MNSERSRILKIIGNNIKNIRKSKGYTQEVFAEKLDKSINYVSLIELGKSGMSLPSLIKICNTLQVDMNCLFKGLLNYSSTDKEKSIIDSLSMFNETDKNILIALISYINGNKEY